VIFIEWIKSNFAASSVSLSSACRMCCFSEQSLTAFVLEAFCIFGNIAMFGFNAWVHINIHSLTYGNEGFWRGGFLTWSWRPKLWGEWWNLSLKFQICSPNILGGYFVLYLQNNPPSGSCAHDAAGIGVADQCRHLLICCAMCPRLAPAASFAWFYNLIVLLYLFLQFLRRHSGTALFKSISARDGYGRQTNEQTVPDHSLRWKSSWPNVD